MSGPPPGLSEPVYDPYNFPNYTDATIARDLTFMVYGAAIYEAIMCLKLYASICSKAKLKTIIFQLITFAVIALSITTLFSVIIQWNQTETDIVLPESEYYLTCFNSSILVIGKYGYYIAATLRTKALLPRFPKILYFFYMMLAACMINNMVLLVLIIKVNNIIYNSTPMTFLNFLPDILALQNIFVGSSAFTTIFDMIFANLLIISFLYPIFKNLGLSPLQAFKKMVQMGDVQKALVAITASIVYPIISQEVQGPYAQLVLPVILFWMHCQNSLFLRLSYFSATQLLKSNAGPMQNLLRSDKSTKDTTAAKKSGDLNTRADTVVASAAATSQMENKV